MPQLIATDTAAQPVLHIASLIVHVQPAEQEQLKTWLLSHSGVEIHGENDQGKLVVVMETYDHQNILDLIDTVPGQEGALNAALVYHEMITEE